jgi:hypothetical protein
MRRRISGSIVGDGRERRNSADRLSASNCRLSPPRLAC